MKKLLVAALAALLCAPALADCVLRQSDAVEITLGPYVDSADGNTEEPSLTISQGDVILKKCAAGGDCAASAQKNDTGACAHDANGFYECDLNATDTDTVGILEIWSHESGALPVRMRCLVVEEAVYDADYAASATGARAVASGGIASTAFASAAITATAIATDAIGAAEIASDVPAEINLNVLQALGVNVTTIATLASQTSFTLTAGSADDNAYNDWLILVRDASSSVQVAKGVVQDYTGSTKTITLRNDPAIFTMATSDNVVLMPANIIDILATLGLASGNLDAQLDPITDIVAGVTAVQAKTDGLTFTVSGQVDANVESMNEVEVLGSGTEVDPWNGE